MTRVLLYTRSSILDRQTDVRSALFRHSEPAKNKCGEFDTRFIHPRPQPAYDHYQFQPLIFRAEPHTTFPSSCQNLTVPDRP